MPFFALTRRKIQGALFIFLMIMLGNILVGEITAYVLKPLVDSTAIETVVKEMAANESNSMMFAVIRVYIGQFLVYALCSYLAICCIERYLFSEQ